MLEFRWDAFVLTIVNFLVLVALLYRFLHKPLLEVLEKRRKRIEDARKDAEAKAKQASQTRQQYERKIKAIQRERDTLLSEARRKAEEASEALIAQARRQAEREVANLRADYENERRQALRDLEADILAVSLETAQAILKKLTDADVENRLREQLIEALDALVPGADRGHRPASGADQAPVRVLSARELPQDERAPIIERIKALAGPDAEIDFETDETLVAGARVEFSDIAVDASLAEVLQAVRERFERMAAEGARAQKERGQQETQRRKGKGRQARTREGPPPVPAEPAEPAPAQAGEQPPPVPDEAPPDEAGAAPLAQDHRAPPAAPEPGSAEGQEDAAR